MTTNAERAYSMLGTVEGRMFARHERTNGTFSSQTFKAVREKGKKRVQVSIRFDDNCSNGHNTFAITGNTAEYDRGTWRNDASGCVHYDIAAMFPELAPYIKWHLTSSDGPTHYVANTVYLAGDRDYNGLRKGESRQIVNGKTGVPCWILEASAKLPQYVDSVERPTESAVLSYKPLLRVGEGKERQLDAARTSAVWPEATDEDLTAPGLKERLEARLPKLLADFRQAMEALGFVWEAPKI